MPEIPLTCTNATLEVDEVGMFHLRLLPGAKVSSADVDALVSAVRSVSGSALHPLLVEVADAGISPSARETLLGVRIASAVALVGVTVVDRVIAAAFMRGKGCPHEYFTSVEDAKQWLSLHPGSHALAEPAL